MPAKPTQQSIVKARQGKNQQAIITSPVRLRVVFLLRLFRLLLFPIGTRQARVDACLIWILRATRSGCLTPRLGAASDALHARSSCLTTLLPSFVCRCLFLALLPVLSLPEPLSLQPLQRHTELQPPLVSSFGPASAFDDRLNNH